MSSLSTHCSNPHLGAVRGQPKDKGVDGWYLEPRTKISLFLLPEETLSIVHHEDMGILSAEDYSGIIEQRACNDFLSSDPSRLHKRKQA